MQKNPQLFSTYWIGYYPQAYNSIFIRLHYRCRLHAECDLDIPKGAEKLEVYKATLAHKANHSFNPNMEWIVLEHPRYFIVILH